MSMKNLCGGLALAVMASTSQAAVIDLGFALDESGSISTANYNTTRDALADAIGSIPTSGGNEYRVAVTSFSSSIDVVVQPTIVTAGNLAAIQNAVRGSIRNGGSTNTALAISNLFGLFNSSTAGLGATTILNITTDGSPNSQPATENSALAAFNAGLDGLSFEAVGAGINNAFALENMRQIAGLGTAGDENNGVLVQDLNSIPDATTTGFVIPIADFAGYSAAISAKIGQVVVDTGGGPNTAAVPVPAGLPLLLTGLAAFGVMRSRRRAA